MKKLLILPLTSFLLFSAYAAPAVAPRRATVQRAVVATPVQESAQEKETVVAVATPAIPNRVSTFTVNTGESEFNKSQVKNIYDQLRMDVNEKSDDGESVSAIRVSCATSENKCDKDMRACMKTKCDEDFAKCALDTDQSWSNKLNECRTKTECSADEWRFLMPELKSDRDSARELSGYANIVNCGNEYNDCVFTQCGTNLKKCLSKANEAAAISKCKPIATKCAEYDGALAARANRTIATLRGHAEKQIAKDEQQLRNMKQAMRGMCERLGALFDERSFNCVYSLEFWADGSNVPYASKKIEPGAQFMCTQEFFGIDLTTARENAYARTRSARGASSAMLGSGIGTAVSTFTGGMIGGGGKSETKTPAIAEKGQLPTPATPSVGTTQSGTTPTMQTPQYKTADESNNTSDKGSATAISVPPPPANLTNNGGG